MERLSGKELAALFRGVFAIGPEDRGLALLLDLPGSPSEDRPEWLERREMVLGWHRELTRPEISGLSLPVRLFLYRSVGRNNGDLPGGAWPFEGEALPPDASRLAAEGQEPFSSIFSRHSLIVAPTEFSTTAPLKLAAPRYRFRAATMPGFSAAMIPALRLDYPEINRRVARLKELLDRAHGCELVFTTEQAGEERLLLDLRFRTAHASGGLFPDAGTAGNLPSGEAYIVPYEGERQGEPSESAGILPVQFGEEVVRYRVAGNRAVEVLSQGPASTQEAERIATEPAYANLAELGLGVLADFGVEPVGELLLDEKLGLHIAFGRSDHFGGQVGAAQFSSPEAVVHIDRVYIPQTQPRVKIERVDLRMGDGSTLALMRSGRYSGPAMI